MTIILYLLFWIPILLLLHSYFIYPMMMSMLAKGKTLNVDIHRVEDYLPQVYVLMAVYNEEIILQEKIDSLLQQDYPSDRLHIYIGSDNSTDSTNEILKTARGQHVTPIIFETRQGKPSIINQLAEKTLKSSTDKESLFLMTDASVILQADVVNKLARHFRNEKIGMVDAHMTYVGMKADGISKSENIYLSSEVKLKSDESKVWGQMIGPFGGCFMMRANLFRPVPSNFLVDDFFISMSLLSDGYQVINDLDAVCHEPVSHDASVEYRRKKRISAGNFQNLFHYKSLLWPFHTLGFSYISHKVIRWIGPILMILIGLSSLALAMMNGGLWKLVVIGQIVWYFIIPMIDKLIQRLGLRYALIRNISYFNMMNVALLAGMSHFLKGIQTSIWQPTKRE